MPIVEINEGAQDERAKSLDFDALLPLVAEGTSHTNRMRVYNTYLGLEYSQVFNPYNYAQTRMPQSNSIVSLLHFRHPPALHICHNCISIL